MSEQIDLIMMFILNSFYLFLRLNDIKCYYQNSKYLFRSNNMRDKIIKIALGVIRFNVSKKFIENI